MSKEAKECKECGNILRKECLRYAFYNWKFCPLCGGELEALQRKNG